MTQSTLEKKIFTDHYEYYRHMGLETIKQQAGQIEQVSSDYEGRVMYELLQNAFDRADKHILVKIHGNSLFVANDGAKFTYTAGYNYQTGGTERSDFQSLCSISTSTKKAGTSIGNKGVGFKSAFSIAQQGYVNLYTQADIIANGDHIYEAVSFRIYDAFKDAQAVPPEFDPEVQLALKIQIPEVQIEHNNRGVPGYYYPLHIEQESPFIEELFQQGYVTVVEIPSIDLHTVSRLLEEMKQVHFQFVDLKYKKQLTVDFEYADQRFSKKTRIQDGNLYSAVLDNELIKTLAIAAGIELENPQVAFSIRADDLGHLYNYLPTGIPSPFPYVDFHADFHTTVDRKGINFDLKIGAYNKALFLGCLELYWSVINSYLDAEHRVQLNLTKIIQREHNFQNFNWNLIKTSDHLRNSKKFNKTILSINDWNYKKAAIFIALLAKKYFSIARTEPEYDLFYDQIQRFADNYATTAAQYNKYILDFKKTLASSLLENGVNIIPHQGLSKENEIIYKKSDDQSFTLPDSLGITVTGYQVDKNHNGELKKALGIKDFNDYNEILKYFKQCSHSGEYAKDFLTESEQVDLVHSIYELFTARNEKRIEPTHRFNKAYTQELRDNNSTPNQANFNVSTVFLKTKGGVFKPAQLCLAHQLDGEFLSKLRMDSTRSESFLAFLGVSADNETIFADTRIYDRLNSGTVLPPVLVQRTNEQKDPINDQLIANLAIITDEEKIHPSVVNDNGYGFLKRFYKKGIKNNLDNLLAKKYEHFPKEYRQILKDRLTENFRTSNQDVIRLYQSVFQMYLQDSLFLIMENDILYWSTNKLFTIVNSKGDFDLITKIPDAPVLCYYSGQHLTPELEKLTAKKVKGEITWINMQRDESLKEDLQERMVYLLISISHSRNTELNFLEEDKDLSELQRKMQQLEIFRVERLEQQITFNGLPVSTARTFAYSDSPDSPLFLLDSATESQRAQGIAEFLFSNATLKNIVELIIFYKKQEDLHQEYDAAELQLINSKWKKDFDIKFTEFQTELSNAFQINLTGRWNFYNVFNRSESLIQLENEGRLGQMRSLLESLKYEERYSGYFDEFNIQVDYSHIEALAAEILVFLADKTDQQGLVQRVAVLSKKIGSEPELENIKAEIQSKYPDFDDRSGNSEQKKLTANKLELDRKIDLIFQSIEQDAQKQISEVAISGTAVATEIAVNSTKTIYQNSGTVGTVEELELTGANGEEQVLNYFIRDFLKLGTQKRIDGVNEVYQLLRKELGNDSHENLRDEALSVVEQDTALARSLISLFYVALHHKFAYFDLIVYKNKIPTLIEVKSTKGDQNRFFISIAEVNAARIAANYELVRVSRDSITFMGNPIKMLESQLTMVKGENFTFKPRNYEFNFKS